MDGRQPGCVERRSHAEFPRLAGPGVCEFDGRLSIAQLGDVVDGRNARAGQSEQALKAVRGVLEGGKCKA